jgi:hypothetical protein
MAWKVCGREGREGHGGWDRVEGWKSVNDVLLAGCGWVRCDSGLGRGLVWACLVGRQRNCREEWIRVPALSGTTPMSAVSAQHATWNERRVKWDLGYCVRLIVVDKTTRMKAQSKLDRV